MIEKPLYQNPLGGGSATLVPNPGAGTSPRGGADMFMGNAILPNLPPSLLELNPIKGGAKNPMDEYQKGYMDSDFYESRTTTNVVPFTYKGKEMTGSGSYASNFKKYLDSIGQGNLIQFPDQGVAQIDTTEQLIESGQFAPGIGQDVTGNNPMEIAVPSTPNVNSFNRVGQQLTGPNQVGDFNSRLNKIEQGIMTLLGNKRQGFNTGYQPNYGFNIGFGNSFPPFGGMYG
jgi:hypothetical protein